MESRTELDQQGVVNGASHMGLWPVQGGKSANKLSDAHISGDRAWVRWGARLVYSRESVDLMAMSVKVEEWRQGEGRQSERAKVAGCSGDVTWADRPRSIPRGYSMFPPYT